MSECIVELATKARVTYEAIHEAAKGRDAGQAVDQLKTIDRLIDAISREPFVNQLTGQFDNTFWIAEGHVRVYYEESDKKNVLVVKRIATEARPLTTSQRAEALLRQLACSGHLNPILTKAGMRALRTPPIN